MFDTVKITFPGEGSFELVPSLDAVELINGTFGDFNNALSAVGSMNFNAIVDVIDAGLEKKIKNSAKGYSKSGLKESIYKKGFMEVMPDAIEFLMLCANGGKRPTEEDGDEDGSKKKTE